MSGFKCEPLTSPRTRQLLSHEIMKKGASDYTAAPELVSDAAYLPLAYTVPLYAFQRLNPFCRTLSVLQVGQYCESKCADGPREGRVHRERGGRRSALWSLQSVFWHSLRQ
jgi:hypothetical protein